MENLNLNKLSLDEKIELYLDSKEKAKHFKSLEDSLKDLILEGSKGKETVETENHIMIIKKTVSIRLDTKTLAKDFPDIKKNYPLAVETVSFTITSKTAEKTA